MKRSEMILLNAMTDALREIEKCPHDSMQDIINEKLEHWGIDIRCDFNYGFSDKDVVEDVECK